MAHPYRVRTEKTWLETTDDLEAEFRRWGVSEWRAKRAAGGAATLQWFPAGSQDLRELTSNDQARAEDNIRKLFLIIEALRLNEARGLQDQMRQFYLQLPAAPDAKDPYETLGVRADTDLEDIEAVYRNKARRLHPDQGGDANAMKELNEAIERIRQEKKNA